MSSPPPDPIGAQEEESRVGEIRIRAKLLRGTKLRRTLKRGGALWRTSPVDSKDGRQDVWNQSEECTELDTFFTHAWASPGWQKYIALLMKYYMNFALLCGVLALLLVMVFDVFTLTRGPFLSPLDELRYSEDEIAMNMWTCVLPPLVTVGALLSAPYLPCSQDRLIFLDAVCINQTDEAMKKEGVESLAGFLANSKELCVLWCPSWLGRRWCAFELATYAALHNQETISFYPLFIGCTHFFILVAVAVIYAFQALGACFLDDRHEFEIGLGVLMLTFVTFLVYNLLDKLQEMRHLEAQMSEFDIQEAECRDQADHEFIARSIEHWHGSEQHFNDYVRGPLKEKMCRLVNTTAFSYWQLLGCVFPRLCVCAASISAHAQAGLEFNRLLSVAAGSAGEALFTAPLSLAVMLSLSWKLSGRKVAEVKTRSRCRSVAKIVQSVLIALAAMAVDLLGRILATGLHHSGTLGGLVFFFLGCAMSVLVFGLSRSHRGANADTYAPRD